MSRMTRRERILAAAAITLAAGAAAASVMDYHAIAAYAASVAAVIVSVDFVYRRAARPDPMRSQVEKFVSTGRKLVIYERDTGIFTHWYVELRGTEEVRPSATLQAPAVDHRRGAGARPRERGVGDAAGGV